MWFIISILLLLYTFSCLVLIFVILIQSGKGGGLSSLGAASQGLSDALGATGAEKTLNKVTTWCAVGFMVLALVISIAATHIKPASHSLVGSAASQTTGAPAQNPVGGNPGAQTAPAPGAPAPVQNQAAPAQGAPAAPKAAAPAAPAAPAPAGQKK
jgi:protein translocase SecG subunit